MSPEENPSVLAMQIIIGGERDADELDRLTRGMLVEVQELDVESAQLMSEGEAPTGTKGADPITLGALSLAVLPPVLPKLVEFIQGWSMRGAGQVVKIKTGSVEVEFTPDRPMSPDELVRCVKKLTAAQAARGP
jgi:hypothetical protein